MTLRIFQGIKRFAGVPQNSRFECFDKKFDDGLFAKLNTRFKHVTRETCALKRVLRRAMAKQRRRCL